MRTNVLQEDLFLIEMKKEKKQTNKEKKKKKKLNDMHKYIFLWKSIFVRGMVPKNSTNFTTLHFFIRIHQCHNFKIIQFFMVTFHQTIKLSGKKSG